MKRILLLLLTLSAASAQLHFEDRNTDNTYRLDGSTLVITSAMGIGTVNITPEGDWPSLTALRFVYASGQGLTRLENLKVSWGDSYLKTNFREKADGFFVDSETITTSQLKRLKLKPVDEALTLILPEGLFSEAESIEIHWVDVYR